MDTETKGVTDERGRLTVACAGKSIRVENLEGGKTYVVEEIDEKGYEEGDYYEPVEGKKEVSMPLYGSSAEVTIINDYILRDLSINKLVVYGEDVTTAEAQAINSRKFTMTVEIDGEPLRDAVYELQGSDGAVETGETNDQGELSLKNGQTAVFSGVAPKGSSYKVTETRDEDYPQVFPADAKPQEGIFGNDSAEVRFINGSKGTLILDKEFVPSEYDNGMAAKYIGENANTAAFWTTNRTRFQLEIKQPGTNDFVSWPEESTLVFLIHRISGTVSKRPLNLNQEIPISVYMIAIPALEEDITYRLTEVEAYRHEIMEASIDGKSVNLLVNQRASEEDGIIGTVKENPQAVIHNEVTGYDTTSRIIKMMLSDKNPVPNGSKLTLCVERYDGQVWIPEKGIPYIVTNYSGQPLDTQVRETGADGKINLYKEDKIMPAVEFIKDVVTINPSKPQKGTLRIVEDIEETDSSWGRFVGYIDNSGKIGLDVKDAVGVVNSNTYQEFQIEKLMENPTEDMFTMLLEQITEATEYPIIEPGQILQTVAGKEIPYTIYDSVTGEKVSEGVTGNKGEILLHANQYASVAIPDGTQWTVQEEKKDGYTLEKAEKHNVENGVIISELEKNLFVLQGDTVPKSEIGNITITREMVEAGFLDANTLQKVDFSGVDVVIPEQILNIDGKVYNVTGIGDYAFSSALTHAKTLKLPNTVTSIGKYAFNNIGSESGCCDVTLPEKLSKIGQYAFYGGFLQEELNINASNIEAYAFAAMKNVKTINLGSYVEHLGDYSFTNCSYLQSVKTTGHIRYVGSYAFKDCEVLEDASFAKFVQNLRQEVFSGCSSLLQLDFDELISVTEDSLKGITGLEKLDLWDSVNLGYREEVTREFLLNVKTIKELRLPCSMSSLPERLLLSSRTSSGQFNKESFPNLRMVELPEELREVPKYLTTNTPITTIIMHDEVRKLSDSAFECGLPGMCAFTQIELPDSLESIGSRAFWNCNSLKEITIPANVLTIGIDAFYNCRSLEKIVIKGDKRTIDGEENRWGAPSTTEIIWEADQATSN